MRRRRDKQQQVGIYLNRSQNQQQVTLALWRQQLQHAEASWQPGRDVHAVREEDQDFFKDDSLCAYWFTLQNEPWRLLESTKYSLQHSLSLYVFLFFFFFCRLTKCIFIYKLRWINWHARSQFLCCCFFFLVFFCTGGNYVPCRRCFRRSQGRNSRQQKQTNKWTKKKKKTFSLLIHWDMIPFLIKAPRLPFSFFFSFSLFRLVQVSAVMMNEYA